MHKSEHVMIIGSRKIVLIGTIGAVALAIILLPYITGLTGIDLSKVKVKLSKVAVENIDSARQNITLSVIFAVTNPTSQTVTTSRVDYELFANGVSLGTNTLSYEDVPTNGRPAIFANQTVDMSPSQFPLSYKDSKADIFNKVANDSSAISWSVKGTATIENALTLHDNTFCDGPICNG